MTPMQKARAAVRGASRAHMLVIATCDGSAECEFRAAQTWVRELVEALGVLGAKRILELAAEGVRQ